MARKWLQSATFVASTTGGASINLPHGTAPSSPVNGDIWTNSAGIFVRIAGQTYILISRHCQVFSRAGDLTVAAGRFTWAVPYTGLVIGVQAIVETAPTGASIIIDVNNNATSMWNVTPANRPTITAGTKDSGLVQNMDTGATMNGANQFTVDIDQVGSTVAGADLTVALWVVFTS